MDFVKNYAYNLAFTLFNLKYERNERHA